jgi:hypothetical protein
MRLCDLGKYRAIQGLAPRARVEAKGNCPTNGRLRVHNATQNWGNVMSNVIRFLESMGANAAMARMNAADYAAAIAMLDADQESREALVLRDPSKLNDLLDGRPFMMCMVAAPEDKPQQDEEAPADGDDGEEKKQAD